MVEPWLIYFSIFAAVFLFVQFAYGFVVGDLTARKRTSRRLSATQAEHSQRSRGNLEVAQRRNMGDWPTSGPSGAFRTLLLQSGMGSYLPLIGLIFVLLWGAYSFILQALLWRSLSIVLGGAGATLSIAAGLIFMRSRRIGRFAEQLPDVIDIVVRSLRAGHPLPVSLSLVAREMPDPAGGEFAVVVDEITYGRDAREALDNLHRRVGYEELGFMVTSISVSYQTGGNLGDILSRLSRMLRQRFQMQRKIKAMSSEGRFSALALSLFPIIMFGIINTLNPNYYGEIWGDPILGLAGSAGAVLLITGNFVMYKMVHFKF